MDVDHQRYVEYNNHKIVNCKIKQIKDLKLKIKVKSYKNLCNKIQNVKYVVDLEINSF